MMSNQAYGVCGECGCNITMGHFRHCSLYVDRAPLIIGERELKPNEVAALDRALEASSKTIASTDTQEVEQLRQELADTGSSKELLELDLKEMRQERDELAEILNGIVAEANDYEKRKGQLKGALKEWVVKAIRALKDVLRDTGVDDEA